MWLVSHPRLSHNRHFATSFPSYCMFVTAHDMAIPVPPMLRESAVDYWAAFKLSNEAPWFLVTLAMSGADGEHAQTLGIAWESTLRSLVEGCPPGAVLSIRRLAASDRGAGNWTMQNVSEVWSPAASEAEFAGPVLLRVASEDGLRNAYHHIVQPDVPGRKLLVKVACSSQ